MTTQLVSGEMSLSGTVSWAPGLHLHVHATHPAGGDPEVWGWCAGILGSQPVVTDLEPPGGAPTRGLSFRPVSRQCHAFLLSRLAIWQRVGVVAPQKTDPGTQGQSKSLSRWAGKA